MINFKDFKKIDLRIGKIIDAEKVENSNKLLNLKVDIGNEIRQILSGIAEYYKEEGLVGKEVVVVINLEPKKMMGLESQGMVLAATGKEKPILLVPEESAGAGLEIT
jgi:methionine--tRNA ligase beta chain